MTVRAVPYLLRLGQLPQNKVDAADVKADFGRGVLDSHEGVQGCPPFLPVRRAHPFLPQPDRLNQGHGAVGTARGVPGRAVGFAPLLVLPRGAAQALSSSLLPVLLPSLLPVLQTWQEVALLTSVKQPRDGEVGQRLPQPPTVSTRCCLGLHTRSSLAAAPHLFGFSFSRFFMKSHGFCQLGG